MPPTRRPTDPTTDRPTPRVKRAFDTPVIVGIGLLVALLVINAGLAYRNTLQLRDDARWVAHSHEVLDLTGNVLIALVDAETGQRGFLITGKDEFLQPYDAALARVDNLLSALKQQTTDNAAQQIRVKTLQEMSAVRLAILKQGIDLRRRSADEATAFIVAGKDKAQMDAIRQHVKEMEQVESDLLKNRENDSDTAYRVAVLTGLLAAVLGLVLYLVISGPFGVTASVELALLCWLSAAAFILLVETSPI